MDKAWFRSNLLSVLNSSIALAQSFVIILFFENYLIYYQQNSLFHTTINFDYIVLRPIISFFFFIAISRIIWGFLYVGWALIKIQLGWFIDDFRISSKAAFTSFLLMVLLSAYVYSITERSPELSPISEEKHPFMYYSFLYISLITLMGCTFTTLAATINPPKINDN